MEGVKITLNKEQTEKFLRCFIDDARRIVIERKRKAREQEQKNDEMKVG